MTTTQNFGRMADLNGSLGPFIDAMHISWDLMRQEIPELPEVVLPEVMQSISETARQPG